MIIDARAVEGTPVGPRQAGLKSNQLNYLCHHCYLCYQYYQC